MVSCWLLTDCLQFGLPLPFQACVELLAVVAVAMCLEQVTTAFGDDKRHIPVAGHPYGFDQALLAEVSKVARPRIGWPVEVVAEVARRHDAKGADGRKRSRSRMNT